MEADNNKDNLYYIVEPGTNQRVYNCDKRPFIGTEKGAKTYQSKWNPKQVLISIKEYEDMFINDEVTNNE